MKKQTILLTIILVIFSLILLSCTPTTPDVPPVPEVIDTPEVIPTNTTVEPEPETDVRFTIQADLPLQGPLTALYSEFFQGEVPVFVDFNGDLLATISVEESDSRPVIPATFLPDSILIPMMETSDLMEFIAFSISPEGQQVLIDIGELPSTITLTDQAGNAIELNQPIRRIISSYGPATGLIYSVGAGDRLASASYLGARDPFGAAAMERIDPRFPDIIGEDNFTVQDFNVEEAASIDPDLIITSARSPWLDTAAQLEIPVFLIDAETPEQLQEAMRLTGQLFGPHTTAQARAWEIYYTSIVAAVQEQTSEIPMDARVSVLFTGTSPLRVASGDMYQTDIINAAGGVSVSEELSGHWNDINLEQVVIWNPDVIIVPPYGGASVEAITESPEWQILDAVESGRVYRMPKLVVPWDTPAPDSVLGIIWMAEQLYPDLVNLECATEAEYFYNSFYNYAITAEEIEIICSIE